MHILKRIVLSVSYVTLFVTCFNVNARDNKISRVVSEFSSLGDLAADTISLAQFGAKGSGKDETATIQKALTAAVGKILFIPKQKSTHYLSGQLQVPSNLKIVFDKGVVFLAKDNLKKNIREAESLFRFEGTENVVVEGNGVILKMNKDKYSSEFNHLIMINGAKNVTVREVNAQGAGGDGFYVGAAWSKRTASENIKFFNCVAKNNRRQGMSVISVNGLHVENCEFSGSRGALPEAGVDIEPGQPNFTLDKIYFKNCIAKGNNGRGFQVILIKTNAASKGVDVTFENCRAVGNDIGFSNRYFSESSKGTVRMINCTAENSRGPGFWEGSCAAAGASKIYQNCVAINNGSNLKEATVKNSSGFGISNFQKRKKGVLGNSSFLNCKSIDDRKTRLTSSGFSVNESVPYKNVLIKNFSSSGHLKTSVEKGRNIAGVSISLL